MEKAPTATAKVQDVTETVKAEASELQFDFYTLLKKTEIIVPNNTSEQSDISSQRKTSPICSRPVPSKLPMMPRVGG